VRARDGDNMKPAPFAYHRATSIDDAVDVLASAPGMARALAGGQSLVPMLNLRIAPLDTLVDLTYLTELRQSAEQSGQVRYGALVTHAAFEDGRVPDGSNGLMPFVATRIAYRAVRTRGTIGGSIALADPAADWLPVLAALDATVAVAARRGRRSLPMREFVLGPYTTVLGDDELIEAISVPRRSASERWGYYKVVVKKGDYAKSLAIALIDAPRPFACVTLGAADGAPLVLEETARAALAGSQPDKLAAVARSELAASGRDFSSAKLTLHTTTVVRAITEARAK
jgi:carbon-monoxide dehydrogenase medium subunit